ncbi:MAG: hypothetical protein CSYNP_01355 [Syntrophus sp. SKADARSKE-3]|nr:hypothetical protein [Syntrophus sp. SKADARSKE-3]
MELIKKIFKIPVHQMILFQFILEGYDRMFRISTLDGRAGIVQICIIPDYIEESAKVLSAIKKEFDLDEIPFKK